MPKYSGKPTIYLDQNILDLFVKNGLGDFGQRILENFQVVYSDENLKEIKRSVGYENEFLQVLKDLGAYHLRIVIEQPGFVVTDNVTVTDRDVFEAFREYCENDDEYGYMEKAMSQFIFKLSGGRVGDSISDINKEQLAAFSQLMDGMLEDADELPTEIRDQIVEYSLLMTQEFKNTLEQLERTITKDVEDTTNLNGIKSYRNALNVGPKELNNLQPPKVIEQIWEIYKNLIPKTDHIKDLEDFFQLRVNPIYPEKPYYKYQQITGMYNMLNTLGYFPDANITHERRFVAAMSDNSHASMASFCNLLLSRDENFVKKVKAIYEYLNVPTEVSLVTVQYS